jgi:predicted NodU family carbamoyl transferase
VYTLGVNLSRHRSACLLVDGGGPIAAAESWLTGQPDDAPLDFFGRCRPRMPEHSIDYCLSKAGISYVDLDVIVFCGDVPSPTQVRPGLNVADCVLRLPFSPQSRMLTVAPVLAHAHGAYHLCGYDAAAIVVTSCHGYVPDAYGRASQSAIRLLERAGIFRAAHGTVLEVAQASSDALAALRMKQSIVEIVLDLGTWALKRTGCDRLCVAGNHTLDAAAGTRLRDALNAREVFVQPVVDDGTALGAALYGWRHEQSPALCD